MKILVDPHCGDRLKAALIAIGGDLPPPDADIIRRPEAVPWGGWIAAPDPLGRGWGMRILVTSRARAAMLRAVDLSGRRALAALDDNQGEVDALVADLPGRLRRVRPGQTVWIGPGDTPWRGIPAPAPQPDLPERRPWGWIRKPFDPPIPNTV